MKSSLFRDASTASLFENELWESMLNPSLEFELNEVNIVYITHRSHTDTTHEVAVYIIFYTQFYVI